MLHCTIIIVSQKRAHGLCTFHHADSGLIFKISSLYIDSLAHNVGIDSMKKVQVKNAIESLNTCI